MIAALTDPWTLGCLVALSACLTWLAVVDLRTGYLPDPLQIALAVGGMAVAVIGSPIGITWQAALMGAAVNGGVFWALRWLVSRLKGREAMGFGDVKLWPPEGCGWGLGPWPISWPPGAS
jgi:leader peptidase (prepilin peptidase)/N-methyltransferase